MAADRPSLFSQSLGPPRATWGPRGSNTHIELPRRNSVSTGHNPTNIHASRRRDNDKRIIENPLDEELKEDVRQFSETWLPEVDQERVLRAARVAKDVRTYDDVAHDDSPDAGCHLDVHLTPDEKRALKAEKDSLFSQRGMAIVILTVSLAAFLQGFVQSSINGASLYDMLFIDTGTGGSSWRLGAANASPWFSAALLGCWISLPVNDRIGRRGSMAVAASLIFASSLGSAFCDSWQQLLCVRIINGIGMGIKAVSTPILASETSVGYWRGTSILAWQLYMRKATNSFNPPKAYAILRRLRTTELQALRDIYLVYKSIQLEEYVDDFDIENQADHIPRGFLPHLAHYSLQYRQLFTKRRLRNALISSSTVALAQQSCGSNLFNGVAPGDPSRYTRLYAMLYSLGFGAVNFLFGLPAIRTIDTLGRRKWLILTLPAMSLLMMAAALSTLIGNENVRPGVVALFVFLFAAAYSPGLGPIPFTLASESFPLSHREAGAASAISINLFFAGLLSICYPSIERGLGEGGAMGLFSGLNFVAFILVFLLLEETKRRSLEDLDLVFAVRKRTFVRHQVAEYLPWLFRRYVLRRGEVAAPRPSLYVDLMWSAAAAAIPRRPPPPLGPDGQPVADWQQPPTGFSSRATMNTAHE